MQPRYVGPSRFPGIGLLAPEERSSCAARRPWSSASVWRLKELCFTDGGWTWRNTNIDFGDENRSTNSTVDGRFRSRPCYRHLELYLR